MNTITILIPKIKPPDVTDIVNNQLNNIFSELAKKVKLKLIWIIFQPEKFKNYTIENSQIVDFHNYSNVNQILDEFKPDLIICEVRLSINPVAFSHAARFKGIPMVTITQIGLSLFMDDMFFSAKSTLRVLFAKKVLGSVNLKPKKLAMLRFTLKRYKFLLNTLKNCNFGFLKLIAFTFYFPLFIIFSRANPPFHKLGSGTLNFCFNTHSIYRLSEAGFEKSSLVLEGDPAFDELYNKIKEFTPKEKSQKIRVLFCPTPMHEHGRLTKNEEDKIILEIINEISKFKEFELALKIHPSTTSFNEYNELLKKSPFKILLYQKEDVIELLNQYDVMLIYGSSDIILEAVLLKKPVIIYKIPTLNEDNRLYEESIMSQKNEISELPEAINNSIIHTISDTSLEKYIEKQIGKFDGKNSERIAERIIQIIKNP